MIESLGTLAEYRDPETGGHIKRTQAYVKALALHLRRNPKFAAQLTDEYIELLRISAPLHDVGKLGVPDSVLLKPGRLEDAEFEIDEAAHRLRPRGAPDHRGEAGAGHLPPRGEGDRLHPPGEMGRLGLPAGPEGGGDPPLAAGSWPWPTSTTPSSASGSTSRPCRTRRPSRKIRSGSGTHFDPDLVEAFLEIHETFRNIALTYADCDEEREALGGVPAGTLIRAKSFLVVDDIEVVREIMQSQLAAAGARWKSPPTGGRRTRSSGGARATSC